MSSSKNPSLHLSTQALFSSSALGGTGDTAASAGSPPKRSAPWAFTSPGKSSGALPGISTRTRSFWLQYLADWKGKGWKVPKKKHSKKKNYIHDYTWMFNWCNQEMVELAPRKWLLAPNRSQETRWFFLRDRFFWAHRSITFWSFSCNQPLKYTKRRNRLAPGPCYGKFRTLDLETGKNLSECLETTLKKHLWSPFPLGCFIKLQISSQSSRIQRRPAYLSRPRDAAARETWRVTTTWSSATPDPQCARQSGRRWYTASHGNSWEVNVLTSVPGCLGLSHVLGWKIS